MLSLFNRWIEILATLLARLQEARRLRHSLFVARQGEGACICRGRLDAAEAVEVPPGSTAPIALVRQARGGFVIFELPKSQVAVRQIDVPAQAGAFLQGIIANQLDRLSPWPAAQTVFGFKARPRPDQASLAVTVLVAARARIEEAQAALSALALRADQIIARLPGDDGDSAVLWSRVADAPRAGALEPRRLIAYGLAVYAAAAFGLSIWLAASASALHDAADDASAKVLRLQRQAQAGRGLTSPASLPPADYALYAKETAPASLLLIEALSSAIPESAYLTELTIDGGKLHLVGLADEAPALIAPLERAGPFSEVHFYAPTTQDNETRRFRFHIEAKIAPRPVSKGGPS